VRTQNTAADQPNQQVVVGTKQAAVAQHHRPAQTRLVQGRQHVRAAHRVEHRADDGAADYPLARTELVDQARHLHSLREAARRAADPQTVRKTLQGPAIQARRAIRSSAMSLPAWAR
jgi:hypothetical protein